MAQNYVRRGKWYHYYRRVPRRMARYDTRSHIRIALKTKHEKEARRLAAIYDDFIEEYWGKLIRLKQQDNERHLFREARAMAQTHGFAYKNIAEVASSPLDERLSRIEAVANNHRTKREALLGGVKLSKIRLSDCLERFWPLCADRFVEKTPDQIRKYKNPRILAMKNLTTIVGDINLAEFERSYVLKFRSWLMTRVSNGEIRGDAANKQLRHIKDVLHTVGLDEQIGKEFKILFVETRFKIEETSRPPFEASFVQRKLLGAQALHGMSLEGHILIYMMAETGARESEIIGLDEDDFFLEPENEEGLHVPHIWIRKNRIRGLKNGTSDRKIPLVGIGLKAAQHFSQSEIGRYQDKPDGLCNAVNKYLRENKLKPTPKHTLYSLRHTFKDRLRDIGAPEEVIGELMGHKISGPKYGRGHMLETKYEWLKRIAFESPGSIG